MKGQFAKYDANKDGALTEDEVAKMKFKTAGADADGDKRITEAELIAFGTK